MTHGEAKSIVDSLGLTPLQSLFLRAVAWHETNYGQGWKPGAGAGSNNMGAITMTTPDQYSFRHEDVRNDKGEVVKYTTWFAGDPTPELGFKRLANTLFRPGKADVKRALAFSGVRGGVAAMGANRYYLGVHRNDTPAGHAQNVADYLKAVRKALHSITTATGEHVPLPTFVKVAGAVATAVLGAVFFRRFFR